MDAVDLGYHVYVSVWEGADGQILPCQREEDNIHDPYEVSVAVNNDTHIDIDAPALNEHFRSENFRELPQKREIHTSFHLRKIPNICGRPWPLFLSLKGG